MSEENRAIVRETFLKCKEEMVNYRKDVEFDEIKTNTYGLYYYKQNACILPEEYEVQRMINELQHK